MQRYASILRGINVSGQKKIKMADLSALYESLGFINVGTYIQSGNVVFEAAGANVDKIMLGIEQVIKKRYGFKVPVLLRTQKEIHATLKANPFLKEHNVDTSKLHVTFLQRAPGASTIKNFKPDSLGQDRYFIRGSEVYLYCPGGYGKTRLSNTFLEKNLGVSATTRNWKTVNMLHELLEKND